MGVGKFFAGNEMILKETKKNLEIETQKLNLLPSEIKVVGTDRRR